MGFSLIGEVTFKSAAYVARYVMKKVNGDMATDHYTKVDPETGEVVHLMPEYTTMSRRPGIASDWLKKYSCDVYPDDFVVMNNKKMRPPKFYDREYELTDETKFRKIRGSRIRASKKHADDQTPERLAVREKVQEARTNQLPRNLENENDP